MGLHTYTSTHTPAHTHKPRLHRMEGCLSGLLFWTGGLKDGEIGKGRGQATKNKNCSPVFVVAIILFHLDGNIIPCGFLILRGNGISAMSKLFLKTSQVSLRVRGSSIYPVLHLHNKVKCASILDF